MADKICSLVIPAVPLTCGLNCNFPDSLGLQLFCSFMESCGVLESYRWWRVGRLQPIILSAVSSRL